MIWRTVLLIFGVFTGATAVIMIKRCTVHPVLLASYRQLFAAAFLLPLFLRDLRRHRKQFPLRNLWRTVLPGLMLGMHFISWIYGARMTSAANSSLIVNMVPVVMPFLLFLAVRERLTPGELVGTLLALTGVVVLGWGDFDMSPVFFRGDLICFASMLVFAVYLVLARRNRDFPSIWLYLVPLYFVGGAACFVISLPLVSPWAIPTTDDLLLTLGLALIPTVMGHSILNSSMKHLRGQFVSIVNLSQFVYAGVMGYVLLNPPEVPGGTFYPACVLVVAGAIVAVRATPHADRRTLTYDD